MTPSVSYFFKLRLKLGVEEGADGPGPLDLGLCERVRDVVRPVYYDQFLGRTPERIIAVSYTHLTLPTICSV